MSLKDHLATLQALLAATPFVTATSLSYEERPPSAGLTKGSVRFLEQVLQEIVSQLKFP